VWDSRKTPFIGDKMRERENEEKKGRRVGAMREFQTTGKKPGSPERNWEKENLIRGKLKKGGKGTEQMRSNDGFLSRGKGGTSSRGRLDQERKEN